MKELTLLQKKLKAPKDQNNGFANFKYRTVEGILEEVKNHLTDECGLTLTSETKEVCNIPFVEATARFTNGSKFKVCTAQAGIPLTKKGMDLSQLWGSATTYAKKMALQNLFLLTEDNDPDGDDNSGESQLLSDTDLTNLVEKLQSFDRNDPEKVTLWNSLNPVVKQQVKDYK
jgi:hypothetical protein